MAIDPFFHQKAFDPETVEVMSTAFESVCADLRLTDDTHGMAEVVARRIVELAANGKYRDPNELRAAVLASFKRGE
jgi:hypothetical protein